MSFEDDVRTDLDVFIDQADFAIEALIDGLMIKGVFDPGLIGDREPRSPAFLCKDSDLATVKHGDPVQIDWTPYQVEQTGVITYWVDGYQPDGTGLATIILREEPEGAPLFPMAIAPMRHGHRLDPVAVFLSQFPINIAGLRHAHPVEVPDVLELIANIDASRDQVTKTGNVVELIVAVDDRQYNVQGGGGVTHGIAQSPSGELVYAFNGSAGSLFKALAPVVRGQPFTVFIVARKPGGGDQVFFDNQ